MSQTNGLRIWVGTASELIVATDLIKKGFEVFRNLSLCGPVDLIARNGNTMLRVQVKTQATEFSRLEMENNDLFACLKNGHVEYRVCTRHAARQFGFPALLKRGRKRGF